jgi:hypothetical protein
MIYFNNYLYFRGILIKVYLEENLNSDTVAYTTCYKILSGFDVFITVHFYVIMNNIQRSSLGGGGVKAVGAKGWQPYHLHVPIV